LKPSVTVVFTLSLPCYRLDDQHKSFGERKKNARLRAQRVAKTTEDKLVRRENRNEKDRVRRSAKKY